MNDGPMIKLAGLYENISKAGNRYFVGYLGGVKLIMLENKRRESEKEPGWTLFVAERPEQKSQAAKPKEPAAPAQGELVSGQGVKATAARAQAPLTSSRAGQPGPDDPNDAVPF